LLELDSSSFLLLPGSLRYEEAQFAQQAHLHRRAQIVELGSHKGKQSEYQNCNFDVLLLLQLVSNVLNQLGARDFKASFGLGISIAELSTGYPFGYN
jgi:hypothetical protein